MRREALAILKLGTMLSVDINPSSEHALFLTLFVSNAGGW